MFAYIKGTLAFSSSTWAVIEAGGVGYKIFIPASTASRLPQMGSEILLHTSFIVRELAQTLYGFLAIHERDFFETLMGVTGIGPKLALSLVGHMPLSELQQAIVNGDIPTICRVPGIGKKNAERLLIELRDKIPTCALSPNDLMVHSQSDPRSQKISDAMSALINLGYNQITAQKAIKKTLKDSTEGIDLATLITDALKNLSH